MKATANRMRRAGPSHQKRWATQRLPARMAASRPGSATSGIQMKMRCAPGFTRKAQAIQWRPTKK